MPRRLHPNGVADFLKTHELGERCEKCHSGNLKAIVWDHYGTAPEEGTPEADSGTGTFIAALVVCDDCGHGLTLDRAALAPRHDAA